MTKLSVVLATFNEQNNLDQCLKSVRLLADEICIVDGTSTDKTIEIAKKYNARIEITTNPTIFHINKQKAIDMARGEWILQLDADEHVSETLGHEIREVIKDDTYNGYWVPRKNYFLGRFLMKGGQYPDYTIRLYRRGKGYLPQKDVHEQAIVEGKVGYLKNALLHFPYKNFSAYITKWMRYNQIGAEQLQEEMKSKNIASRFLVLLAYCSIKPLHWFFTTYIRHKGFMDGWPGFVFSFFSSIRFFVIAFLYLFD